MGFLKIFLKEAYRTIFSIISLVLQGLPDSPWSNRIRGKVLGAFMAGTKRGLQISKSVHILYPYNIRVGDGVFLGYGAWINAQGGLEIGDETILGPYVCIATGNHTKINGSYRYGPHEQKKVVVGRGCWLAAGVKVMPGANVNDEAVLAAGAVLIGKAEGACLYAGVPAKRIKDLV